MGLLGLINKLVTFRHVGQHVLVGWASFIVHAPASIEQFKAVFIDEVPHLVLHALRLTLVPHRKELHLHVREATIWVIDQSPDRLIKDEADVHVLNVVVDARVVLIDRLEPAHIVMGVVH